MDFLKKNWLTILLVIALGILLYIFFHRGPQTSDHSGEKKTIDSLIIVVNTLKHVSNVKNSIDSSTAAEAKRKADSLQLSERIWYARAKTNEANAKYYALLYSQAKDKKDTNAAFSACDQIIQIVDSQNLVINVLHSLGDSIEVARAVEVNHKDSIIQTTQVLLKATDNALTETNKAYQGTLKDLGIQTKSANRNRTLSRILALTTIILGAVVYIQSK